ncbi:MAG: hypothetical protein ACRDQ2_08215, partial [Gaiellales bacterium]
MEESERPEFEPSEFEEPELPTEPPEAPAPEFEEIDEELIAKFGRPPDEALVAAHQEAEASLLLDVSERALAAESGTTADGFENIVGVGIAEKVTGGKVTGQLAVTVYVVAKASPEN